MKWKQTFGIFYDKVLNKLKDKFYMMAVGPVMMYDAEYWATKGPHPKDEYRFKELVLDMSAWKIVIHVSESYFRS
jgi:hypothetical protein